MICLPCRQGVIRAFLAGFAAILGCGFATASGQPPHLAFLSSETSPENMGPHDLAAWETAKSLGDATLLCAAGNGAFTDTAGQRRSLDEFDVVWYHQGDAIARNTLYGSAYATAFRQFAERGKGMLFSGGALALVDAINLEPIIRCQRRELEHWRDPAALVPVEKAHPVFAGLTADNGLIGLSRGGCKAVADFYWGGPAEGMVLGNTSHGVERPLVEYAVGAGRVIVFGWRWPDYADKENPYRSNLLRITSNMIAYLADAAAWRPVVIPTEFPALAHPEICGVTDARWNALRRAIEDLMREFPGQYVNGPAFFEALEALKAEQASLPADATPEMLDVIAARFEALQREALLANPLLDFERLLMIRRRAGNLGLPLNYHGNDNLPPAGYANTLVAFSLRDRAAEPETLYTPEGDVFIGDIDLHYDAERLLLSIPDAQSRWGVAEFDLGTRTLTRLPLIDAPDVHNYDACYLPDERIVFTSTAPFIGVPCVGGSSKVANLYLRACDGSVRRLTNDQDHNWCPTVLNNGRILYQRWEYADIAHTFTRLLFHANPDGSDQMAYYGSNSFWPTAMFYARPVPGHPTKVVTVVGGHHDAPRQGELVILDPALGRAEAGGAVQRIPGFGEKVEPVIIDGLIATSWPRFLHPFPLSEKYFLVSCKPAKNALWGIYLVDVFDNFVLLREEPDWALLEPIPWRKTPRPPIVPDRVDPATPEATVLMADVYFGPGLEGVPRGTVKSLRLVGYDFTFHGMGGEPDRVGLDGPWDVKRIIGTVPVEADGSAAFIVPACTPVAVQPLDKDGKALALMRSWFTAAPGEVLSCVGCHEKQNTPGPIGAVPAALRRAPSAIQPWYGPARNFSFEREVQPVLDAYCVACHNGGPAFDLTARPPVQIPSGFQMHFSPSYMELRRWVHTPTLESDAHLLSPRDFHADTSLLVQILRDGHYGVGLSDEAWSRLITWIDLNAPCHGTWAEVVASDSAKQAAARHGAERRRALQQAYAGIDEDPEAVYPAAKLDATPPLPDPAAVQPISFAEGSGGEPAPADVPVQAGANAVERVELAEGVSLELVRIAPGQFVMGSDHAYPNEAPAHTAAVDTPFLLGRFEVTNAQYECFDPDHDSGLETGEAYQFGDDERGFPLNRPEQPVVRVSWDEAVAFCDWLTAKTGRRFSLPTETQWEYACRAGTTTTFWYGGIDTDFSACANLSDATHHTVYYPHVPDALPPWRPADTRFDDTWRVSAPGGTFAPNPWGLCDMHGNVAEWTASEYADAEGGETHRVVRGGSWMDCPRRARSAFRLHYAASQRVHDVGFRVMAEDARP